jgi:hypothetical protein
MSHTLDARKVGNSARMEGIPKVLRHRSCVSMERLREEIEVPLVIARLKRVSIYQNYGGSGMIKLLTLFLYQSID